ncbi:MAG: hypothetical protein QG635_1308, partial [Bacteroidota bacterium]|nr:hypothetical protein [Bacteroidota bacterium]
MIKLNYLWIFLILIAILFATNTATNAQKGNDKPLGLSDIYDVVPDLANCNEGALKDSEKMKILAVINQIRSFHGLKPVTYDYAGDTKAMKSSLVCAANGNLSHNPPTSWKCYSKDADDGAVNSNLYIQSYMSPTQLPVSENSIVSWMYDNTTVNVGHRRAIMNPFVTKMSFGRADGMYQSFYVTAMSLKYLDNMPGNLSGNDIDYVAYPQNDYPPSLFDNNWYLSFSCFYDKAKWGNNTNVDYSAATIDMKKEGTSTSVQVLEQIFDLQGWGGIVNCLKWKVPTLEQGVKYNVTLSNVKVNGVTKSYSY